MFVCLSVCIDLCSVWLAKRLGRSRPNLTHALMSTQGVFLTRSMSRSFMYACGSDRITKHPARCAKATRGERCSNYVRRTEEATPGERLRSSVRTTGNYSSSNEARHRRRRAASAEGASRTPSGGRVITASKYYLTSLHSSPHCDVIISVDSGVSDTYAGYRSLFHKTAETPCSLRRDVTSKPYP